MNDKKAPAYEEAARHLDRIFTTTLTFPSVRELKAKCGNVGSLSTYKAYKDRWLEDRLAGSGVESVLMAMRMERDAHASIMNVLNGKLARLLQMFPGAKGYTDEDAEDIHDGAVLSHDGDEGTDRNTATAENDESRVQGHQVFDRARSIAAQSEARFTEHNETGRGNAASVRKPGPNAFGPDDDDPIDRAFLSNEDASPSRSSGGGQQAIYPTETNKPASGEGDTRDGWRIGGD